jgi:uncharacterized protein YacL
MFDALQDGLIEFVDKYTIVIMGLLVFSHSWPIVEVFKIKFPSKGDYFWIDIKPHVVRLLISQLPIGFLFGIVISTILSSSLGLLIIPICTSVFPVFSTFFLAIKITSVNQRNRRKQRKSDLS